MGASAGSHRRPLLPSPGRGVCPGSHRRASFRHRAGSERGPPLSFILLLFHRSSSRSPSTPYFRRVSSSRSLLFGSPRPDLRLLPVGLLVFSSRGTSDGVMYIRE